MSETQALDMKVRPFKVTDFHRVKRIFQNAGLPENCMPDIFLAYNGKLILNPRFAINRVVEDENGEIGCGAFLKITSEPFLLMDPTFKDPVWRWKALTEIMEDMAAEAKRKGLDETTCWVPPHLVESFGPRLQALGFVESPWVSFTKKL